MPKKITWQILLSVLLLTACMRSVDIEAPSVDAMYTGKDQTMLVLPTETSLEPALIIEPTMIATEDTLPTLEPAVVVSESLPETERTYGPDYYPQGINPLTGTPVEDPALLERRPIIVKVQNLPRESRPQWGLSKADWVYEYYTEFGSTRFAAVFYGQDANMVAPVRSGRFIDIHLVKAYQAIFAFGSAYEGVFNAIMDSNFSDRLVLESPGSCPAICRYDPNGKNYLIINTEAVGDFAEKRMIDNQSPAFSGYLFSEQTPEGGELAKVIDVRYSGAIYNQWRYSQELGQYLRFVDAEDDINRNNPVYEQLVDRLTDDPIAADNLLILEAEYLPIVKTDSHEVYDVNLFGTGDAYLARNGKIFSIRWIHQDPDGLIIITASNGQIFPLKPGTTWVEVIGQSSDYAGFEDQHRFTHWMP
jgi:hypothetical protein